MINLLPPPIKEQLRFSRWNRQALGFMKLLVLTLVIIGASFVGAIWRLEQQAAQAQAKLDELKQSTTRYKEVETQVSNLNTRLNSIKALLGSQAKFSQLLADLAVVTPRGVQISGIVLTGDANKAVRISFSATSYPEAVGFREALTTSPRIQASDIESLTADASGIKGSIVISFKAGLAK